MLQETRDIDAPKGLIASVSPTYIVEHVDVHEEFNGDTLAPIREISSSHVHNTIAQDEFVASSLEQVHDVAALHSLVQHMLHHHVEGAAASTTVARVQLPFKGLTSVVDVSADLAFEIGGIGWRFFRVPT
jgi:hypothetical protein